MSSGFEIITVSQLNYYVRSQLDGDPMLRNVFLRGEISNFTNHYSSGHLYMSLKDENAVVRAVMFRGSAKRLFFAPENGMKVIAMGRATLYDRDGQFQFYIDDMQPDGVGALHVAFEQLKSRLTAQGLFDEARKRPLPAYPERIGIVTSPTGAALQDILNILGRRWPLGQVILYPVLVQGPEAPEQIVRALGHFGSGEKVDVVIVGRGGGSLEELWAFNDESVARAIASCAVPVVSAVGHETDYTIADFAADLRAPTPSAAAELVSPDLAGTLGLLESLTATMERAAKRTLQGCSLRLDAALSSPAMKEPAFAFGAHRARFEALAARIDFAAEKRLERESLRLSVAASKLDALSPLKVLGRGYAIASDGAGVISDVGRLSQGKNFKLTLRDGFADCSVLNTTEGPEKNI